MFRENRKLAFERQLKRIRKEHMVILVDESDTSQKHATNKAYYDMLSKQFDTERIK